MGWFHTLCRNVGLMIHNVRHPDDDAPTDRKVIRRDVEEHEEGDMTVRRTTIEEIEFKATRRRESDD